jgi:hypothetical protein
MLAGGFAFLSVSAVKGQEMKSSKDESVIQVNPASKARIKFENDMWNFGSMPKGVVVMHAFKFKNVGQDTLVIVRVRPTCGCTTAQSSERVAPGDQAAILTTFNSEKFNGRVNKQILIDTNDPVSPYLKVSFTATINNPLQSIQPDPTEADFGYIKKGQRGLVKINLVNNDTTAMNLVIVEASPDSLFRTSLLSSNLAPHMTTDLAVELEPQTKLGEFRQSITLESKGVPESRITIPIKGIVSEDRP